MARSSDIIWTLPTWQARWSGRTFFFHTSMQSAPFYSSTSQLIGWEATIAVCNGLKPLESFILMEAPYFIRFRMHLTQSAPTAWWRGVALDYEDSWILGRALCSNRSHTMSHEFYLVARCKGVSSRWENGFFKDTSINCLVSKNSTTCLEFDSIKLLIYHILTYG